VVIGSMATRAMKATMTTKTTTWAAQIAVAMLLLATGTASASSGLLSANSPRDKNPLEGSFHLVSASVSGEPHQGWGEVCAGSAADSVVAPRKIVRNAWSGSPGFPQSRTCGVPASGSSSHGLAAQERFGFGDSSQKQLAFTNLWGKAIGLRTRENATVIPLRQHLVLLHLNGKVLRTTPDHPF
jgi:hypothetical protein